MFTNNLLYNTHHDLLQRVCGIFCGVPQGFLLGFLARIWDQNIDLDYSTKESDCYFGVKMTDILGDQIKGNPLAQSRNKEMHKCINQYLGCPKSHTKPPLLCLLLLCVVPFCFRKILCLICPRCMLACGDD